MVPKLLPVLAAGLCLAWSAGLLAQTSQQSTPGLVWQPAEQGNLPSTQVKLKWLPGLPEAAEPAARSPASSGPATGPVVPAAGNSPSITAVQPAADPPATHPPAADPPAADPPAADLPAAPLANPAGEMAAAAPDDRDPLPSLIGQSESAKQRLPTIQESIARQEAPREVCPLPRSLRRISKITTDISPQQGDFPPECGLGETTYRPRCWAAKTFNWTASGLCHKPLYFEDEQLERYGHSRGRLLQPLLSPAKFFLTFPVLPYAMGLYPPNECIYTLGCYRPGDCSPYMTDAIPLSVRAGLVEAAAWTGGVFALP